MDLVLLAALAAAPVPAVTAGPNLADQAQPLTAEIADVTVYSDRAQIVRRAETKLTAGIHVFRLPDLPGATHMDTVRVGATGAKILRVEVAPVERERVSISQVDALLVRLEKLRDELAAIDDRMALHTLELGFVAGLTPAAPVPEKDRVGRALPPVLPDVWAKVLGFLDGRRAGARKTLRKLAIDRRDVERRAQALQREIGRHDLGGASDRKLQVLTIIQATQTVTAKVALEYFVPGAYWKPAYELRFSDDVARVAMATAGLVQQATGEDWNDVRLHLSTAIPGRSIELPEMLTWALGERKEFVPRPRAKRRPQSVARFAPPRPTDLPDDDAYAQRLTRLEEEVARLKREIGRSKSRLARLNETASVSADGGMDDMLGGPRPSVSGVGRKERARRPARRPRPSKKRAPPPPPSRPMPMPAMEPEMAVMADAEEAPGMLSGLFGGESKAAMPSSPRVRVARTSMGLFEPTYYRKPSFSDGHLPAVTARGLDYVWDAPARATIPSRGENVRVPLAVDEFETTVFYEATPSLTKTAYLKATVENARKRPVLAGSATIFVGSEFGGDAFLETTGPGGTLELPLGADEDVRLTHTVVPSTETVGLLAKQDRTTYRTTIEVGNYKKRPIRIFVTDQVPKTSHEDIHIEDYDWSPAPLGKPDAEGLLKWRLDIPAGQTVKVGLVYVIHRPEDWQLQQR